MTTPEISPAEAAHLADGGGLLLDVREPDEWEAGHAPSAIWIPLGELGVRLDEVPTERTIAVICRSGARSATATDALRQRGLDAVNVEGGMQAWSAEDLPVVASDGLPGTVI